MNGTGYLFERLDSTEGISVRAGVYVATALYLISLTPGLWGEEIPELSRPILRRSADYPKTVGGAPSAKGFSEGIPRISAQTHGWKVRVLGPRRLVRVKEIVRAPGPNTWRTWDTNMTLHVSSERDSCMRHWLEYPKNGWIKGSWTIEPCDPRGWYSFEIYFDGKLASRIPFEVK